MAPVYISILSLDTLVLNFARLSHGSPAEKCPEPADGAPLEAHAGPIKPLASTTAPNAPNYQEYLARLSYRSVLLQVELPSLQPDGLLRKWRLRISERRLWLKNLGESRFARSYLSWPATPCDGAQHMDHICQANASGTGLGMPLNSSTFCHDSPYARLVLGGLEHQPAPTTSTKGGARKTTAAKFRCIFALSPASCKICRTNSPTTFPDIAHLREHIYRCGVYCECGEKVLAFKSAAEHHDHSRHGFQAVAGPSNRWPYNTCLPFEVLKAINTADTTQSSRRHHFQLDDDGQRWVSIWCTIADFYHQHTGEPRWDCEIPWPYDTPQTAIERPQSTPSRPSRLAAPNMISSQSVTSNASFTTTSDLSAGQYSFTTDSAPAGHLPHTYGPTIFTGATSEPPAEMDAMFGLTQSQSCPAQEDFPEFPVDLDVPTDMTNYTGQHEYVNRELDLTGSEDILGFLHQAPHAIEQIPSAIPTMPNTRSSMRGGLVPLPDQSDLAWRDAHTGLTRPLPELEQNELIAIIEYQYSELRRRQN